MDLTYLFEYVNLFIFSHFKSVGFALKTAFAWFPNKYIPLAALTMGFIVNVLINLETGINAMVVLGGMISGLASTGLYEMLRNLLDKDGSLSGKK